MITDMKTFIIFLAMTYFFIGTGFLIMFMTGYLKLDMQSNILPDVTINKNLLKT